MAHQPDFSSSLRVRPAVWRGLVPYFAYMVVFYAVFTLVDVQYLRVGESVETLWSWFMPPNIAAFAVTVIFVSAYGWWKPALREPRRIAGGALWLPILAGAFAIFNLLVGDLSRVTPMMWVTLVVGCLMVGFNEELINRGLLIVGLRARFGETSVWLLSTFMFAVFHLPNVFYGVGWATIFQVCVALGMGSLFYLVRRTTGSLIFAMLLHALWDFSSFTSTAPWLGLAAPVVGIAAIITVIIVLARERRTKRRTHASAPSAVQL